MMSTAHMAFVCGLDKPTMCGVLSGLFEHSEIYATAAARARRAYQNKSLSLRLSQRMYLRDFAEWADNKAASLPAMVETLEVSRGA